MLFLSVLLAACERPPSSPRSFWREGFPNAGTYTAANETREALIFQSRTPAVGLGRLGPGTFTAWLSIDGGDRATTAELEIRSLSWWRRWFPAAPRTCVAQPAEVQPGWQSCRIEISSSEDETVLEVRVGGAGDARLVVAEPQFRPASSDPRRLAIILVLDALRRDVLSVYGAPAGIGTHLARFARDAIVFEDVRSTSSWTRTAVASLLTGKQAEVHRTLDRAETLPADLPYLPSAFARAGFATRAWSSNANILPLWGFARDVQQFVDVGASQWVLDKRDAEEVFAPVLRSLRDEPDRATFAYIHLMDTHHPYEPPPERKVEAATYDVPALRGELDAAKRAELTELRSKYVGEVLDVDAKVGAFLDELRELGLYDLATILIVADHGEEFGEHGGAFHGKTLFDEVLRVPAILKLPRQTLGGTRVAEPTSLDRLAPEFALAAGLPAGSFPNAELPVLARDSGDATSFVFVPRTAASGPPAHFARLELDGLSLASVHRTPWKLIADFRAHTNRLFQLGADPAETEDVSASEPDTSSLMRRLLGEARAGISSGWHVRACGASALTWIDLTIWPHGRAIENVNFEFADKVDKDGGIAGAYGLHFDLATRTVMTEMLGRLVSRAVRDDDEVVIPPGPDIAGDAIEIQAVNRPLLGYKVGSDGRTRLFGSGRVRLKASDAIRDPGEPFHCERLGPMTPYVGIWFVPPAATIDAPKVAPDVVERLKGLGYVW